jgi:hypothetical protein
VKQVKSRARRQPQAFEVIEPDHLTRQTPIEVDFRAEMAIERERRHRRAAPGTVHRKQV